MSVSSNLFFLVAEMKVVSMDSRDETVRAIQKYVETNPDDASAWNSLGVLHAQAEEFGEALRCFNRAIRLNPELTEAYTNRGRVLIALGLDKAQDALKSFDTALRLSPGDKTALMDKSYALRALGRSKDELACLLQLKEQTPDDTAVILRIGDINLELGHFKSAVASYEEVISLNAETTSAYVHMAIALGLLERWKEAIKAAKISTKLSPDDLEAWRVLADVNVRAGKNKSAMKALKKAAEIDPEDASVENTIGMLHYKDGRLKEAVKHFNRALIRQKNHTSALRNMGFTYMELEQWENARDTWSRLTSLLKTDADVYDAQATTYARLDDFCSASEAWQKARKLYKRRGDEKEAARVANLGRAARINCSRQKKAAKEQREHDRATRTFDDRFELRRKKGKKRRK
jgi:tetratricopeptide (TPR) repeat protein